MCDLDEVDLVGLAGRKAETNILGNALTVAPPTPGRAPDLESVLRVQTSTTSRIGVSDPEELSVRP